MKGAGAGITVALVKVNGDKVSTLTDGQGKFTFTDVTPPYDLYTYSMVTATAPPGGITLIDNPWAVRAVLRRPYWHRAAGRVRCPPHQGWRHLFLCQ